MGLFCLVSTPASFFFGKQVGTPRIRGRDFLSKRTHIIQVLLCYICVRIDLKVMIIRNRDPFRINTLRAALASVSWDCLSSSLFEEEKIYPQHWLPCHLGLSLFKFVRGSEEKNNAPER